MSADISPPAMPDQDTPYKTLEGVVEVHYGRGDPLEQTPLVTVGGSNFSALLRSLAGQNVRITITLLHGTVGIYQAGL